VFTKVASCLALLIPFKPHVPNVSTNGTYVKRFSGFNELVWSGEALLD
jgi:hypothetical protein